MPNFRNLMSGDSGAAALVEVANSALYTGTGNCSKVFGVGNANAYTISGWVSRCKNVSTQSIFAASIDGTHLGQLYFNASGQLIFYEYNGGYVWQMVSTALFRDFGSWYHIMASFTNNSVRIWVNGVEITAWATNNPPSSESSLYINKTGITHYVGEHGSGAGPLESYVAELVFLDGLAITDPTSFGEFDATGNYWTPKSSTAIKALTFGTNGFYLDNTTNAQTDASGNGNNFTNNNTVVTSTHTPTHQECLFNPIATTFTYSASSSLSNGNRSFASASQYKIGIGSLNFPKTGKWWVAVQASASAPGGGGKIGVTRDGGTSYAVSSTLCYQQNDYSYMNTSDGYLGKGSSSQTNLTSGLTSWSASDEILVAFDADNETIKWYLEGALLYTLDISAAPDGYNGNDGRWRFAIATYAGNPTYTMLNESEYGFTLPTGYEELNTTNIAAATTRTQSDPYDHWNNILYTGNGTAIASGGNAITGAGFAPDFGWIKGRSGATEHVLTDIVRGVTKELSCNDTGASETVAEGLTAFGSDGFTVGSNGSYNTSSATYVAWLAKLGGTASTNEDGTIDSSVSVNQTLGMSVGTYTGDGGPATIGHGLGATPKFVIVKSLSADAWQCYHFNLDPTAPEDKYVQLNGAGTVADLLTFWNDTAPTSSVFTVGTNVAICNNSEEYMFIAFAPSEYISIGGYEGNANADGTFVPTLNSLGVPIQPIFTILKGIDSETGWYISDAARSPANAVDEYLVANTTAAEVSTVHQDYVSGGTKLRSTSTAWNRASTYIHLTIGIPTIDVDGRILAGR